MHDQVIFSPGCEIVEGVPCGVLMVFRCTGIASVTAVGNGSRFAAGEIGGVLLFNAPVMGLVDSLFQSQLPPLLVLSSELVDITTTPLLRNPTPEYLYCLPSSWCALNGQMLSK